MHVVQAFPDVLRNDPAAHTHPELDAADHDPVDDEKQVHVAWLVPALYDPAPHGVHALPVAFKNVTAAQLHVFDDAVHAPVDDVKH